MANISCICRTATRSAISNTYTFTEIRQEMDNRGYDFWLSQKGMESWVRRKKFFFFRLQCAIFFRLQKKITWRCRKCGTFQTCQPLWSIVRLSVSKPDNPHRQRTSYPPHMWTRLTAMWVQTSQPTLVPVRQIKQKKEIDSEVDIRNQNVFSYMQ